MDNERVASVGVGADLESDEDSDTGSDSLIGAEGVGVGGSVSVSVTVWGVNDAVCVHNVTLRVLALSITDPPRSASSVRVGALPMK